MGNERTLLLFVVNIFVAFYRAVKHFYSTFLSCLKTGGVVQESPDLEKIGSDRNIRKTGNVFKNLGFCGKRKNGTLQLLYILKRRHLHDYKLFVYK